MNAVASTTNVGRTVSVLVHFCFTNLLCATFGSKLCLLGVAKIFILTHPPKHRQASLTGTGQARKRQDPRNKKAHGLRGSPVSRVLCFTLCISHHVSLPAVLHISLRFPCCLLLLGCSHEWLPSWHLYAVLRASLNPNPLLLTFGSPTCWVTLLCLGNDATHLRSCCMLHFQVARHTLRKRSFSANA